MRELATVLGYTWVATRGTDASTRYLLTEGVPARNRTRQLRLAARRAASAELQKQLALLEKYLRKYHELSPKEAGADADALRTRAQGLPTGPERLAAEEEAWAADTARTAETGPFLWAYSALPAEAKERVLQGERVVMANRRPGAVALSPQLLESIRRMREVRRVRDTRPGEPPPLPDPAPAEEALDWRGLIRNGQFCIRGRLRQLPNEKRPAGISLPNFLLTQSRVAFGAPLTDNVPGKVTADRPEDLNRQIHYAVAKLKRTPEDVLTYARVFVLPELLRALAGLEPSVAIVGDAYLKPVDSSVQGSGETLAQALSRLARPGAQGTLGLGDLLRVLAAHGGADAHVTSDGWIRLRSTTYFEDQERIVDPQVVLETFRPLVEKPPYSLAAGIDIARALSYEQASALSDERLAFLDDLIPARQLRNEHDLLRLLGRLSERNRQTLLGDGMLRYARVSRPEQEAFRSFLGDVSSRIDGPPLDLELGAQDLPLLSLACERPARGNQHTVELRLEGAPNALWRGDLRLPP